MPKTGGQDGLQTSYSMVVLETTGANVYNNNDDEYLSGTPALNFY